MGYNPVNDPQVVVVTRCPPLKEFEATTLMKAGREARGLLDKDAKAAIPQLLADRNSLRRQCRSYSTTPTP